MTPSQRENAVQRTKDKRLLLKHHLECNVLRGVLRAHGHLDSRTFQRIANARDMTHTHKHKSQKSVQSSEEAERWGAKENTLRPRCLHATNEHTAEHEQLVRSQQSICIQTAAQCSIIAAEKSLWNVMCECKAFFSSHSADNETMQGYLRCWCRCVDIGHAKHNQVHGHLDTMQRRCDCQHSIKMHKITHKLDKIKVFFPFSKWRREMMDHNFHWNVFMTKESGQVIKWRSSTLTRSFSRSSNRWGNLVSILEQSRLYSRSISPLCWKCICREPIILPSDKPICMGLQVRMCRVSITRSSFNSLPPKRIEWKIEPIIN